VGPLGFSKLFIASGRYDRCVVRRFHQFVLGPDIDPVMETGSLYLLTAQFVNDGRKARPFVKGLTQSDLFEGAEAAAAERADISHHVGIARGPLRPR
jgi:hypothetical protein